MNTENRNLSMVEIVPLRPYIDRLLKESDNVAIQNLCNEYAAKLNNGMHDEQICEAFVKDLAKVANTEISKGVLADVSESIKNNEGNIKLANDVYSLSNSSCMFVAPMIESAVVDYITNKNSDTRDIVKANISIFENEKIVRDIMSILDYESYEEKSGKSLVNAVLKESAVAPAEKTYTQAEVDALLSNKVNEQETTDKSPKIFPNRIGLHDAIRNIMEQHSSNEKLKVFCEQYMNALNAGKAEETLYEAFISGASNWNYLNAVDTELSALKDRVGKYKQDIDLKKIMEMMKETSSYYIVPLIEDVLIEYVNHKNMTNRGILLQRLDAFGYDPFVRDIVHVVTKDNSIPNSVYLGESIEFAKNLVHTEDVFSPVKYIKENECVFNVKGSYYVRKGNSISKMTKNDVAGLSESFKTLCGLINSSNIVLSNELNTITVFDGENKGVISESAIEINGEKIVESELESLASKTRIMNEDNYRFYNIVKILNENFGDIAYLDFVKRVASNDGSRSVDVFRIKNNLFLNTIDESLGRSVFYRNVNPIQCRNYINEHMEINIAPLFEDVLPDQDNIEKTIKEKCNEYDAYIESLESKKDTLMKMKGEGADEEDINKAIDMINQEIEDAKADYKKYQDNAKDYLKGKKDDAEDSMDYDIPDGEDKEKDSEDDTEKDTEDDTEKDTEDDVENGEDVKETPAEMEEPLTSETPDEETPAEEVSVEVEDEHVDAPEFDAIFDVPAVQDTYDTRFKIAKVTYNKNVKTGKVSNHGEVIIIIPTVDANGDIHDETRKVQFYLDPERNPVIENEYMPLDLYMSIKDAIESDPKTESVEIDGTADQIVTSEPSDDEIIEPETLPGVADTTETITATEIPAAEPETPAEVKDAEEDMANYPIMVGVYPEEISPKGVADFEKDMDDMKIEHSNSEADGGEIMLKINNLAQAHGLQKYFNKWFNYTDNEFKNFFPELKRCFDNKCSTIPVQATNEGVKIIGVSKEGKSKYPISLILPCNECFCKMVNTTYEPDIETLQIVAENENDMKQIYEGLFMYAKKNDVDQDVEDILESYKDEFGAICESECVYNLTVPYNAFLEQKLTTKGFDVNVVDESMSTEILKTDYNKARKILESFYGENVPAEANDFFRLQENVKITIKDESTGKTVEINTEDDIKDVKKTSNEADFDQAFKDVTFNPEASLMFSDDEESADDEDKDEKDEVKEEETEETETKKEDEGTETEKSEKSEDEESEEDSEGDKKSEKRKTFKFKVTKKSKNESLKQDGTGVKPLNESADKPEPNVLDIVLCKDGKKGQVICKQADGNLIVNVEGHTKIYAPGDLTLPYGKFDTLEAPFKYDANTLKGVYESFVKCGIYINDVQVTPNDCQVQLLEYLTAPDDAEINLIIEGQKTPAVKKYIKITEDIDSVIDMANYGEGKIAYVVEGKTDVNDVLVHLGDYKHYRMVKESNIPVRVLLKDDNGETHLRFVAGGNIRLNEGTDVYTPDYELLIDSAINLLS